MPKCDKLFRNLNMREFGKALLNTYRTTGMVLVAQKNVATQAPNSAVEK